MRKLALLAALLAGTASPVLAQLSPDQIPAGVVRGIQEETTSGQVGEVAIDANTIRVDMKGTSGKPETVTIDREFACSAQPGNTVAVLGRLSAGNLVATAPFGNDRLLSGNYSVVVHNNTPDSARVACGHLYGN
jgi:hypothetical protein